VDDQSPIYLDYNATTPLLPEVVEGMLPYLRDHFGNPSSGHAFGRRAREAVSRAREQVAALLGAAPDEIVFTSGGTEANNLAIRGTTEARSDRRHIVTSVVEHPATEAPCRWLEHHGWRVSRIGVDADGRVKVNEVEAAITSDTALVTIMHANNETGVVQPVVEVARAAHGHGALVHTDAAQSVGKIPVNVNALDVDLLSVAGHKLYAPKGVGALFVRRGTPLAPFALGAGHEGGIRPGTENVASIVGLGIASEIARRELATRTARMREQRDLLLTLLRDRIPGLAVNGHASERLPNTLNVRFPGVSGNALLAATPEIAASTGSACHDTRESPSAMILAMGVPPIEAIGSVRLSLGCTTTREEVERVADALVRAWQSVTGATAGGRDGRASHTAATTPDASVSKAAR
jgi:cysteine desulfurase